MEPVQILLVNELGDKIHQGILWADHQAVVAELEAKLQQATEREAALRAALGDFTFEDAKAMLRGAHDVYGGGYHGPERAAFRAGLQTAFRVLENARRGDTQTAANLVIGKRALAHNPKG